MVKEHAVEIISDCRVEDGFTLQDHQSQCVRNALSLFVQG